MSVLDMSLTIIDTLRKSDVSQVDRQQSGAKNVGMNAERRAKFAALVKKERQTYPTRTAFCQAVGITRSTLRALESGAQDPTDETIEKLARVLHKTPEEITGVVPLRSDDPLLKDLGVEDLLHANQFHRAPAEAKHAAKDFLSAKIPDETRVRLALVLLLLMRHRDALLTAVEDLATAYDADLRAISTTTPVAAPRPVGAKPSKR
jgi:transcriptional regulator with XRE-family HTH domain